ncbi:ABC transporter permease subunit [Modestobacter sp. I12A-02628]|uniref:Sugar ABC transporter permease n=1 Tax=Goekera deserti TaxID=2497753 RepID=A0A7K3WGF4_9ACTN|nr:sugar ABC transporter permease [Goekera deserti]MPQ99731.1 ABC transporter permease subunit [Goekera deserti]NDI46258.1 ABC transporter permease subunit [Goekera deserti]NEL54810.1 sugar ABC transporter permease [Goekera deserti]
MTATMGTPQDTGPLVRGEVPVAGGERAARPRRYRPLISYGRWWWALPAILMVLVIHYLATAGGALYAFTDWTGIGDFDLVGLDNFRRIFEDPTMIGALENTLFLAFGFLVLTNVVGLALALALNRTLKTRYLLRVLFFTPVVLSPLAVSYVWKFIFDFRGPLNTVIGWVGLEPRVWLADPDLALWCVLVVMAWQTTGMVMVIYLAGLATVSPEVEEAAALDGAGTWQRFRYVTVPSIRPSIAIASTLMLIQGLRVFDQVMALTGGGPAGATETLATQVYKETFALSNFGFGAALALLLTLIMLVFSVLQQAATRDRN